MFNPHRNATRPFVAAALLGLLVPLLAACSGTSGGTSAVSPVSPQGAARQLSSAQHGMQPGYVGHFKFKTLDDPNDKTFNQLLGINDAGVLAGYYGSGASGHPNQGYIVYPPYSPVDYTSQDFPGAAQTQVTSINKYNDTAGFYVDSAGTTFGFQRWNGVFFAARDPLTGTGTVNQLLGINDTGASVGFYVDGKGHSHGYEFRRLSGKYIAVDPPGGTDTAATGINDNFDAVGFETVNGALVGFVRKGGNFTQIAYPGAAATFPAAINKDDTIVGFYANSNNAIKGFKLTGFNGTPVWTTIAIQKGFNTTWVTGINDAGDMVGWYIDQAGNNHGFIIPHQ